MMVFFIQAGVFSLIDGEKSEYSHSVVPDATPRGDARLLHQFPHLVLKQRLRGNLNMDV
jgi:hypothetical protein